MKLAKEDPVTLTGGTEVDTTAEQNVKVDRGAMPATFFEEREGGEAGPSKISQGKEELKDVGVKDGGGGGKLGGAPKSELNSKYGDDDNDEDSKPPGGKSHVPDYSH